MDFVRSRISNTRCLFGWFFFNLLSSQVVTTGTNFYLVRKARVTVYKVTLQITLLSCLNLLVSSSFHLSQRITLDYVWQFLLTRFAPSSYLRSYKIIFYLKFLILTVEIGQNRNEIGNIKIITNLLAEYYSHPKGHLTRKLPQKTVT